VDGGGTKTVAWLGAIEPAGEPVVLGAGRGGPGNPRAAGFDRAFENLDAAIAAAFQEARLPRRQLVAACLALAGSDRDADRARILAWAEDRQLAQRVRVVHDAEPIVAAGTPEGWGLALIAGTGSLAYGRNRRGATARVGGWGYLFGDEGSGYAIGLAGLRAAARCADGRGPTTDLLNRVQSRLGVTRPSQLVETIYQGPSQRREIAHLATAVVEAAQGGDWAAGRILARAAQDLAEMVNVLRERLELPRRQLPLALAGSLLLGSRVYQATFLKTLRAAHDIAPQVTHVAEPVRGALLLARDV
jgi:N-acetylglucosamine kinase-like BadF-type ATPase